MKFIIGKKISMTQIFEPDGKQIPVTLVSAGPCLVTQVKTKEKDGYSAIQIGYEKIADKRIKKTQNKKPYQTIKEFRIADTNEIKTGDTVLADAFKEGDVVKVRGISKGKGYQGVVRRYGYKGRLSVTHGTKHELRNLGSVGCQGGVRKGKGMPGHMGTDKVTVKNLVVAKVDAAKNLLALKGSIPGHKGTIIEITGK